MSRRIPKSKSAATRTAFLLECIAADLDTAANAFRDAAMEHRSAFTEPGNPMLGTLRASRTGDLAFFHALHVPLRAYDNWFKPKART